MVSSWWKLSWTILSRYHPSLNDSLGMHTDESLRLGQYLESQLLSALAQVYLLVNSSSGLEDPMDAELSKGRSSKRQHLFIPRAHTEGPSRC